MRLERSHGTPLRISGLNALVLSLSLHCQRTMAFTGLTGAEVREIIDTGLFAVLIVLLPFAIFAVLFQLFCIAWAPFAALICEIMARKRGLNAGRYALVGAVYSVWLFVPWMDLIRRMRNPRTASGPLTSHYNLLYAFWLGVIIANGIVTFIAIGMSGVHLPWMRGEWTDLSHLRFWAAIFAPIIFPTAIGLPAWVKSRQALSSRNSREREEYDNLSIDLLPEREYIMPFALASANILVIPIVWLLTGIIMQWTG